jgi:hypothetical protein
LRVVSTASPLSISSLEACATFHSTDDRARPGCQTFAAERCKLLLITSTQISSIHPQYGPSLRTRIVIISRHVRSRGVDELKMLLLMPQKFNIPTLKIRPSIADAMEHDQTRSHRLKLRSGLLNAVDQPCLHASCPPHARHAASTPHAAMTVTMTPCTQERACKRWRGRDSLKSHS